MASEADWILPEPLSVHEVPVEGDATIAVRRHGNPEGTRLVLSHGIGLSIDLYYPFWSLLTDEFDVVVYDLRSHGWNAASPLSDHTVPTFVDDHDRVLDAIDSHFGAKPQVGVFHSVSSLAPLLSTTEGRRFSALVLFDPPLRKPVETRNEFDEAIKRAAKMAEQRTYQFKTLEAYADLLAFLPPFRQMVPGVHHLMASTTLREAENGSGFELRFPREHEAQIMAHARIFAVLVDLDALQCPTKVIGADPTLPYSYLPTLDFGEMLTVDYDFLPDATHFLQLEQPDNCVAIMRKFLEPIGLA